MLIRRLGLGTPVVEQQFRRMVFNVVARNQDDHVKNIAFLMDRDGRVVAGARLRRDLGLEARQPLARQPPDVDQRQARRVHRRRPARGRRVAGLKRGRAEAILAEVGDVVAGWREVAEEVGVDERIAEQIARSHRLTLPLS